MAFSLKRLFNKKVLLLCHAGADVDSFSSAASLYFSLKGTSQVSIGVPDHMNNTAKALAKNLSVPFTINPSFEKFDSLVLLDFNKSSMFGSLKEQFFSFKGEKFLIDHHSKEQETLCPQENLYSDSKAISTTELVYQLLENLEAESKNSNSKTQKIKSSAIKNPKIKNSEFKIPKKAYLCIACGIITDSSSFLIADHSTFSIMSSVLKKAGSSYAEVLSLFSIEKDFSEKIASLKAAKRARFFKCGNIVVAISEVGAFEADAASSLIRAGADVAFCGYSEDGKIRVSGRVNNNWLRVSKFDLAKYVFNPLEKYFKGEGGGHPGAAGFNGEGDSIEPVLIRCATLVNEFTSLKSGKKSAMKEYS